MSRPRRTTVVAVVLAALLAAPACAQRRPRPDDPIDPARVLSSIDRAVGYLKRRQNGRGGWPESESNPGGVSSLATLAQLKAGLDADEPEIEAALAYLRDFPPRDTYVVSLQTMVFAEATPRRDRVLLERNARWLERAQQKAGDAEGGWGYGTDPGRADPSNSQFALLGLYAAQQAGVKVDPEAWRSAAAYWRKRQNDNGSWSYDAPQRASGSMTCAGIGALVITALASQSGDARIGPDGTVRCCQPHTDDQAIERGLAWLGRNFSVRGNPIGRRITETWHYYYLYALERAGRLSARRFIDQHDWYREGTEFLVNRQEPLTDTWVGSNTSEGNEIITTSFGLLFLSKGRRPVVLTKLRPSDPALLAAWGPHRRDAAHLTHAAEVAWDLPMTWQTIDPARASVDDLSLSPVLYASGDAVAGIASQGRKLRAYLDKGGFLFAESPCDGGRSASCDAIERLVTEVFPEPEHRLRQIEPGHPVWRMERLLRPESEYVGSLWGVEYGCRTCVVFCDRDLSCYWELDTPTLVDDYPPAVASRVEDARTVGLNVLAYATGREPLGKEQQFVEQATRLEVDGLGRRGVIEIAKLQHTGGCNDAPGAVANLLRVAAQGEVKLRVAPTPTEVAADDPALPRHHFAFMHGRRDFQLSGAERRALGEYLERGGTLLADSICASPEFARAFRREVALAVRGAKLEAIPPTDPLLTDAYGGFDVRRVDVRDPQPTADDEPLVARVRRRPPQLEGIRLDDRWAVVFSPLDLSCALEQHEAVQCRGYRREDAARIGLNVLLYSINW